MLRKRNTLPHLIILLLLVASFASLIPFTSATPDYWFTLELKEEYGERGETIDITVNTNYVGSNVRIFDPSDVKIYDQDWSPNETRNVPISESADYGTYRIVARTSSLNKTTRYFTVLNLGDWSPSSMPLETSHQGLDYAIFNNFTIKVAYEGDVMWVDFITFRELYQQYSLDVTKENNNMAFKFTMSKTNKASFTLIFAKTHSGIKFISEGSLDRAREIQIRVNGSTLRDYEGFNTWKTDTLAFNWNDLKDRHWFSYDRSTGIITIQLPKEFRFDPQISACDSLTDWSTGNGVDALDTADKQEGTASINVTGNGTPWSMIRQDYDPSGTWDWSSYHYIIFWLKPQTETGLEFRIYTTSSSQDYIGWTTRLTDQTTVNVWTEVTLYFDHVDGTDGTFNNASVTGLSQWMNQPNGGEVVWIDDIRVEANASGNNAPTADSVTITNMVDSDNVYSQHKDYNFNFTVTDADGVAELDFITFALEIGGGWVNGTIDCQSNALNMDVQGNTTTGAVTNSTSGNSANYILPVKTDWDINEASDNDIHFQVNDTSGDGPAMAEKQTDYFDTVNDLVTNSIECTDANNPDRVDISSSIQIDFTAYYENDPSSGTASSSYPPDAEFTSISVYNEWDGTLGADNSIVNGAGSVTGTSNASVQSTDYNLYINGADADYPDGEEALTEAIITDRVNVTLSVPDTRINISTSANIGESAVYEYDGGAHAGTITLNDTQTKAAVGNYTYTVSAVTDTNYGLTAFLSNDVWCVFDQQQLQTLGVNNSTPAANENVTIWATAQSPFDNHVLGAGDTLVLEDTDANTYSMSYNGSHWVWVGSWAVNGTITINTYNSVNETTYIITTLDMNGLSLTITVGTTPPPSGNTFDLRVILSEGVGIQNANVRLYNSSGDLFSVNTNSTGYIAQQTFDSGNYTLTILRTGFTLYNHTYSWTADIELIIALTLDTELAGMGILPLFLGFIGLVVILAANKRRR